MKNIRRLFIYIFSISLLTTGCNKKELAMPSPAVVKIMFQGYSIGDTLEAVKNNQVIATMKPNTGFSVISLVTINSDKEEVRLRKKGTTTTLNTFEVNRSPFVQQRKIFFDGETVNYKMDLTPVSNPKNIGFRVCFKSDFPYFYGGPVDFEIFERTVDNNTFEYTDKKVKEVKNVGSSFGEFVELPYVTFNDQVTRSYIFHVYKAGTKELPYKEGVDLSALPEPDFYCGTIDVKAGQSALIMVSPYYYDKTLGDSFQIEDIAFSFR